MCKKQENCLLLMIQGVQTLASLDSRALLLNVNIAF